MMSRKIAIGFSAAAIGLAIAMPATAQQDDRVSIRSRITAVNGTDWQNFYSTDASASAGTGMRSSTMGTAADRNPSTEPMVRHHGANPANLLCDSLQGQAQENCLASFSAGGGLQQGSDGD